MTMVNPQFNLKQFTIITLVVSLWVNLSEVFRYFVLVMPRVKAFFGDRAGVAEMNWKIFSIWGLWDTLLTAVLVFVFWLYAKSFGNNTRSIVFSGVLVWASIFIIFWVAMANMGLSKWKLLWITLPLSLLEMLIGAWIASRLYAVDRWVS